jgi:aspartyl-tRNA(Asn)/glutamyl-tRNA(Gln) amidotransferase subunit C
MSSFSPDDVRRLASLARLQLSDAEIASFARQLGEILDFARQVQSAGSPANDGTDPAATGTVLPASAATRDDEVRASLPREAALAGAPEADARAGLFKVPRVLNA